VLLYSSLPSLFAIDGGCHPMCRCGTSQRLMPNDHYHGVHIQQCIWWFR
jgi:hypothetical protein